MPEKSFAPWSSTKADVALACSLRFNLKYDQRMKGKPIERGEGRIGSAVHAIIEKLLKGSEFDISFKEAAIISKLTRNEMFELRTYQVAIENFLRRYDDWRARMRAEEIHIEKSIATNFDLQKRDYWDSDVYFRGVLDLCTLIQKDDKRYAIVMDHKTGKRKELSTYEKQLRLYNILALVEFEGIAGAQSALHWVRESEDPDAKSIDWDRMYTKEKIEAELVPWFHTHLSSAQKRGQSPPQPTEGWYCGFCEYQHICPLKK